VSVDRAVKWGFNHELGPFELWDAIEVRKSVERMQKEGTTSPITWRGCCSRTGTGSIRRPRQDLLLRLQVREYLEIKDRPEVILLLR